MAGIYIHIPFCKQSCNYCDFHFRTSLAKKNEVVNAILKELYLRKNYLNNATINTIYFGGGTPSLLKTNEIESIIEQVYKFFKVRKNPEITLESNPDDLTITKLKELKKIVNRLSIGIQSFDDAQLKFLNRVHSSKEAERSIFDSFESGFENISIDLIYGIDPKNSSAFPKGLDFVFRNKIPHVSCYALTIEQRTVFGNHLKNKTLQPTDDGFQDEEFQLLIKELRKNEYLHYEISNAAISESKISEHNSSYWKDIPYLGIGPGAHSYDLKTRFSNFSNNTKYIKNIQNDELAGLIQPLKSKEKANEYILTSIRTIWGLDTLKVKPNERAVSELISEQLIVSKKNKLYLTEKGKSFADYVSSKLFF